MGEVAKRGNSWQQCWGGNYSFIYDFPQEGDHSIKMRANEKQPREKLRGIEHATGHGSGWPELPCLPVLPS